MKIVIIGAGIIAHSHLSEAIRMEQGQITAIADINREKADATAEKYAIKAYTDYIEMLEQEQPDIAVITLPHFLHYQAVSECAKRGCSILLEKPMAMNEKECDGMISLCEKCGVKLMIGHVRHFSQINMRIRDIVQNGTLGRLIMMTNVRYVNYFHAGRPDWFLHYSTAGGGIVMNLGAHSFDLVQYLSGSRICSVSARVGKYREGTEIEGNGQIFATLENGVTASITLSGYELVARHETELVFTNGMMKTTDNEGGTLLVSVNGEYESDPVRKGKPFLLQLESFAKCVRENLASPVTGEYGKSIIHAIQSSYRSSEEGGKTILL